LSDQWQISQIFCSALAVVVVYTEFTLLLLPWTKQHSNGYVINIYRRSEHIYDKYPHFPVKGKFVIFLSTQEILNNPALVT